MEARQTLRNAYAGGTYDNLNTQWVKYLEFCVYFELAPFPASTLILVWYTQYLSRTMKAHGTIVGYLAGVKTLHTLLNFSVSGFHGFLFKLTLHGLRQTNDHIVKRARPITPAILRLIHNSLDHGNPVHTIFWGICI